jgi:polyisoprenoid-binding protein YceI
VAHAGLGGESDAAAWRGGLACEARALQRLKGAGHSSPMEHVMSWIRTWIFCLCASVSAAYAGDIYRIDPEHTFSTFEYSHWGLSLQRGRFDKNAGVIELDKSAKTGAIDIQIDTASVNTGSELFNRILRSDSFFDAEKYPQIVFKSTSVRFDDDRLVEVVGDLTIKNVTRQVSFEITHFECRFMIVYFKSACGANGFTRILRSDFNVGRYVPFVGDEVTLYFSIEGIRE